MDKVDSPESGLQIPQIAVISADSTNSSSSNAPVKYADDRETDVKDGDKFTNPGYQDSNEMEEERRARKRAAPTAPASHVNTVNSSTPLPSPSSSLTTTTANNNNNNSKNIDRDDNNNNKPSRTKDFVERIDVKPLENDIQIKVDVVEVDQDDDDDDRRYGHELATSSRQDDTVEEYDDSNPFKDDLTEVYSTPASTSKFSHSHLDHNRIRHESLSSDATCIILSEIRL